MSIVQIINKSMGRSPKNNQRYIPIYSIPDMKDFHTKNNKLEAVVLLTTSKEINNGSFSKFINILLNVTHVQSNIDFVISINNNKHDSIESDAAKLKSCFKNIYYYNININPSDDIYTLDKTFKPVPKYGLSSGPNLLFIKTMKQLQKYDTVLTLETDCILYENWLNTLINYVEYCGDFIISGSTYDGNTVMNSNDMIQYLHINGVALYKTESNVFQFLLNCLDDYILKTVSQSYVVNSYDCAIYILIFDKIKTSKSIEEHIFWKVLYRYITKTTFIINASLKEDANIPESIFLERFPKCVILHKKSSI